MHAPKENPLALAIVWIISAFLLLSTVGYMFKSLNNHSSRIIDSGNASPKIVAAHINPDDAIEQHLEPVGKVVIDPSKAIKAAPVSPPTAASIPATPTETVAETETETETVAVAVAVASNEVVTAVCSNCHSTTMATIIGAPEMHSDAWAPRMEKGFDAVLNNAINGLNAMPPRGGNADLTDEELAEAIRFMSSPAK
ncbi:MAG: c-type cytochrome [Gammaproteobacteria bacterium]|nr:c-type cytochrome [Gammaproteobacteria bacterium]